MDLNVNLDHFTIHYNHYNVPLWFSAEEAKAAAALEASEIEARAVEASEDIITKFK